MISTLFRVLDSGFSLLSSLEKRKYRDKLLKLEKEFYIEDNKEISDDSILDNIRMELLLLSNIFNTEAQQQDFKDQ